MVCATLQHTKLNHSTATHSLKPAFGLRNVTRTLPALKEVRRVLKKGGRFMCMEFSKVNNYFPCK